MNSAATTYHHRDESMYALLRSYMHAGRPIKIAHFGHHIWARVQSLTPEMVVFVMVTSNSEPGPRILLHPANVRLDI